MMENPRRPRRWPWIVACAVLFGLGFLIGGASFSAFTVQRFAVACPPLFSPRAGEVEPLPRGPGVFPPRALARPTELPSLGRLARVQGETVVLARVEADGNVSRTELVRSSGFCPYDVQALVDVRRWKFQPARRLGNAFASWMPVTVHYVVGGPPPPSRRAKPLGKSI